MNALAHGKEFAMKVLILAFAASSASVCGASARAQPAADEEFAGPFPGWANVKTDFGAIGDGVADDTAALQKAIDQFTAKSSVLFLPAGVYRITRGLSMTSHMYVAVLGEDPATTTIRWDGASDGTMILCNGVRYSKIGRLTWDGGGRPVTALWHRWDGHTPNAATGLEHADEVFRDVAVGLRAGLPHFMDAECLVQRCKFLRCSNAGLIIDSMNALDWWLWHCEFAGCRLGATNAADGAYGGGHFHIYESLFRESTEADIRIGHCSYFGIRNNMSVGSRAFFRSVRPAVSAGAWKPEETWGSQVILQGNTILDPQDPKPIRFASSSSVLLMDNVIRGRAGATGPVCEMAGPAFPAIVAIGNTVTTPAPFAGKGKITDIDTRIVTPPQIDPQPPRLPGTPPRARGRVLEVPAKADLAAVQEIVDQAAGLAGGRPVVHLASGTYGLAGTLVIPAGADLQLIGDGSNTVLAGTVEGGGPVLLLRGPSRATLREFAVTGPNGVTAIRIEGVDGPGGLVFGEQLWAGGTPRGLLVRGLAQTRVELRGAQPGGGDAEHATIEVDGSAVAWFGGATSGNHRMYDVRNGGSLLIRDTWFEGSAVQFLRLNDRGDFTLDGGKEFCGGANPDRVPTLLVDGFRGRAAFIGLNFTGDNWLAVRGTNPETRVLALCCLMTSQRGVEMTGGGNQVGVLANRCSASLGSEVVPDAGNLDPAFLREALALTRTSRPDALAARPAGVTDLRLHRIRIDSRGPGLEIVK
jgi:hypothetical protein